MAEHIYPSVSRSIDMRKIDDDMTFPALECG